ncbi:MAG TPA: hypothetical protein DEX36_09025 [Glutamicibacter sp.]|nr:hypothetical protein [Glutamicibacter sp.]
MGCFFSPAAASRAISESLRPGGHPEGTYRAIPSVDTIGVGNLLMARADMPEELAGAIVKLLANHADQLIPESSSGIQYLTPETLISTGNQPLHPGARKAYQELHG